MKHLFPLSVLAILSGAICLALVPGESRADSPSAVARPVLLELFTSQGCSSCPPADHLAGRLAKDPSLVVISRPVTYWDRLGWKDTLAREENTKLQRAYAARKFRGSGVYTPQMVVNGSAATIGSRRLEIEELVQRERNRSGPQLAIRHAEDGGIGVGLSGKAENTHELLLVALASSESVAIGRGENSGRRIVYANVVRAERRIGQWNGGVQGYPVSPDWLAVPGADRFAVILREPDGGRVTAAAYLPESI